jgi:tetratricopeptide (TPR) repeat protein
MTRVNRILFAIIVIEVAAAGIFVGRKMMTLAPPAADYSLVDHVTARSLREAAAKCKTAEDWRRLGELYMGTGYFSESELCHHVACELEPANSVFAYQWGFSLERLSYLNEANLQYRKAMEQGYSEPDFCRYYIGRNLLRQEKPTEARAVFEEGRALPACRYELARLHLTAGELQEATRLQEELARNDPDALQLHLLRYRIEMRRGDARQAFIAADRMMHATGKFRTPFQADWDRLLAVLNDIGLDGRWKECRKLIDASRFDEAEKQLRELLAEEWHANGIDLLAEIEYRKGNFKESIRLLTDCIDRAGASAHTFDRLGDTYDSDGQFEWARLCWAEVLDLDAVTELKNTHHKLADSYERSGDKPRAAFHLSRTYFYAGLDLFHSARYSAAADAFGRAIERDPQFAHAWYYLGDANRQSGRSEQAEKAYAKCLGIDPNHGRAAAALAFLKSRPAK